MSSTRYYPGGGHARIVVQPPSLSMLVRGQGFGGLTPSVSAVATCKGWYLFSTASITAVVKNSTIPDVSPGTDRLVESGNDRGDYSFTTLPIGHKNLSVELSVFCRSKYLFVGRKVTTESDFDIQNVVV